MSMLKISRSMNMATETVTVTLEQSFVWY